MSGARKILWTAAELLDHAFPPILWIVPKLITSGLTLIVGAPKLGKSWLSLSIGYAVSVGGAVLSKIKVPEYDVLYLALEDTPRRLQSRLEKIGADRSSRFYIITEWKPGAEGIERLHLWMEKYPDTKLIIIDTWGRWASVRDGNDYGAVTEAAAALKSVADQYDIAIVAVHHTRKAEVSDYLDATLGSTGLAAAADSTMVLRRGRGNREATLSVTGRDIEEAEYVLHFDSDTGTWALQGTTAEVQETGARQEIFNLLRDSQGMTPKQVADELGKNHNTVKQLLWKMANDGSLVSLSGIYRITVNPVNRKPEDKPDNPKPSTSKPSPVTEFTGFTGYRGNSDATPDSDPDFLEDIF
jgi:DNA-binding NarL/FixJ family response regulator